MAFLKIDGTDFTHCVIQGGIKWQMNDLDSTQAGRTLDGVMHRGRVSSKVRLDISCMPLKSSQISKLLQAIYPEFVTVEYDDPMLGRVSKTMYSNNRPATCIIGYENGEDLWDEISFPLIER